MNAKIGKEMRENSGVEARRSRAGTGVLGEGAAKNECWTLHSSALSFPGAKSPQMELSYFPGNESSMERKYLGHSLLRSESSTGAKVLGLFAPLGRMFQGTKVPRKRKFHLWTFRSRERKCRGTKSPDTKKRPLFSMSVCISA